ncbi:hypothetical protein ALP99_101739 [Pseudomonas syringae pv. tomato]|uniref:Uncharacterized protein n=2 Tax=Pseudomonas syringae group TaxID=136849 RepID=A0A0Q0EJC9_PSESX|nr:Unknown protein sequence [Pseudomonas syringae pv. maculicola]KPB99097.1 Unknown protein sequence [Pseudomonas syringae pv. maculicola str. M6]KPC08013.1 Unknown protein sequence [Pseudomonas amygdali pv. lachrymans]KPW42982.1 hypothetical protein ALO87_101711 [Pseudomonas syringae pv. apii]KPW50199.1 hypothetical protein ALO88_101854 [Pseudomonas syringae pv. antirrhini]KPY89873.1 hypothetical protein ALO36_102755 [Pseudomonas syringae pv. tomato]KPZ14308.1 hypothetical protein ALO94_1005
MNDLCCEHQRTAAQRYTPIADGSMIGTQAGSRVARHQLK